MMYMVRVKKYSYGLNLNLSHNAINKSWVQIEAMFKDRKGPCAFNKTTYEKDNDFFKCLSSVNVYHCIQDDRSKLGEICAQPIWVDPSK